jgi:putative Mn2+ efflux pump MntP
MKPLTLLLLAVGLGVDAMSVSMAIGVRWHGARQKFRLAWHMGLFQFLMPLLGYAVGHALADLVADFGTYLAAAMVFLIGLKMLIEAVRATPGQVAENIVHAEEQFEEKVLHHPHRSDPTKGWSLLVLSVATSLDAMVAGFSVAMGGGQILRMAMVIGLVAAVMVHVGMMASQRIGQKLGRPAEIAGALLLMGLAISFLVL